MWIQAANRTEAELTLRVREHHPGRFVLNVTESGRPGLGTERVLDLYMTEAEAVDLVTELARAIGQREEVAS